MADLIQETKKEYKKSKEKYNYQLTRTPILWISPILKVQGGIYRHKSMGG